jgi:hypothetical protein
VSLDSFASKLDLDNVIADTSVRSQTKYLMVSIVALTSGNLIS